jgi:hypothetical protein
MSVSLRATYAKVVRLMADDPEGARRQVREAMAQWSKQGYLVQHMQAMRSEVDTDIYVGDGASAYERIRLDTSA